MSAFWLCLFWLLVGVLLLALLVCPALVVLAGLVLRRRCPSGTGEPQVSVLIAAYNEEAHLRRKIQSVLAQRYPRERLELIVVNDGSTDGTQREMEGHADDRLMAVHRPRSGKNAALSHAFSLSRGEVIIFMDATSEVAPETVAKLVRPFDDPTVGGVSAWMRPRGKGDGMAMAERLFWRYDFMLKRWESWTGSIVAAFGSCYAIRRGCFEPVPREVTDDFFLSTAPVERGLRLVLSEEVVVGEVSTGKARDHYRRRVRITLRGLASLWHRRRLLNPWRSGWYALVLWTHKVLRRACPPVCVLLLPVSGVLAASGAGGGYAGVFLVQAAGWGLGLLGWLGGARVPKLLGAAGFALLNVVAVSHAIVQFVLGGRARLWETVR